MKIITELSNYDVSMTQSVLINIKKDGFNEK
jgi:hypothetical protein